MSLSIPAFHVSDPSKVSGSGSVFIASRQDGASSGIFNVRVSALFDPVAGDYPTGTVEITANLSESSHAVFKATSIELMNSHGKHNPTVFMTGRCSATPPGDTKGHRFWLMIANNKKPTDAQGTPDVVSFAVHDRAGNNVAYGTGPLRSGDFEVMGK